MTTKTQTKDLSQYGLSLSDLYNDLQTFNGKIVSDEVVEDYDGQVRLVTLWDGKEGNFYIRIEEVMRKTTGYYAVKYVAEHKIEWYSTTFAGSRFATVECKSPRPACPGIATAPKGPARTKSPLAIMNLEKTLDYCADIRGVLACLREALSRMDGIELEDFDYRTVNQILEEVTHAHEALIDMKVLLTSSLHAEDVEEVY